MGVPRHNGIPFYVRALDHDTDQVNHRLLNLGGCLQQP